MAMFGNFILRFIAICFGFTFAVLAAGLFVGFGFYNEVLSSGPLLDAWEEEFYLLISMGVGFFSTVMIGVYSFGIVGILIAVAELMRWKGFVANLVMGGACGAFLALMNFGGAAQHQVSDGALLVSLSAGFIGGFVYWLIAGRSAGDWLGPEKMHEQQ